MGQFNVVAVPNEDGVEKVDVPNRGNGVDVDDEVAVPNREELVFDVEEEIKCGTARRKEDEAFKTLLPEAKFFTALFKKKIFNLLKIDLNIGGKI
ncbi:hypothetical protein NC651_012981 [Populus alba x Populus x berolinensis]|nr:hypothetical protein NC651_012981 [Populus alba x Populus x berolinensis]